MQGKNVRQRKKVKATKRQQKEIKFLKKSKTEYSYFTTLKTWNKIRVIDRLLHKTDNITSEQ